MNTNLFWSNKNVQYFDTMKKWQNENTLYWTNIDFDIIKKSDIIKICFIEKKCILIEKRFILVSYQFITVTTSLFSVITQD